MNKVSGAVDFQDFGADFPMLVARSVRAVVGDAQRMLAQGESARWTHSTGCANSSPASTKDGVLHMAEDIAKTAPPAEWEEEDMGEPLFGAHLRRTIRTIRSAFNR